MASKLSKTIGNATPLNYVGRLRYFDPHKSILDFNPSKRVFRRIQKSVNKQLKTLSFYDLNTLIAPNDRWAVHEDFMYLDGLRSEQEALELLRAFIIENHFCSELVRVAYDPTAPLPKLLPLLATQLLNAYELVKQEARKALKQLGRQFRFSVITPAIQLPQRSPNAPNTAPALSLVAA
jgi:hypothetical protein